MLRANPKGGRPLKGLGAIDWDGTYGGFQYKLGYCEHGGKILASGEELTEIVQEFGYLVKPKKRVVRGVALYLLKKLV